MLSSIFIFLAWVIFLYLVIYFSMVRKPKPKKTGPLYRSRDDFRKVSRSDQSFTVADKVTRDDIWGKNQQIPNNAPLNPQKTPLEWSFFDENQSKSQQNPSEISPPSRAINDPYQGNFRVVSFSYADSDGVLTHRKVSVHSVNSIYLDGFCFLRNAERTFRLDRIIGLVQDEQSGNSLTVEEFTKRLAPDVRKYVAINPVPKSSSPKLHVGPRGGVYYFNAYGQKVYIKN